MVAPKEGGGENLWRGREKGATKGKGRAVCSFPGDRLIFGDNPLVASSGMGKGRKKGTCSRRTRNKGMESELEVSHLPCCGYAAFPSSLGEAEKKEERGGKEKKEVVRGGEKGGRGECEQIHT